MIIILNGLKCGRALGGREMGRAEAERERGREGWGNEGEETIESVEESFILEYFFFLFIFSTHRLPLCRCSVVLICHL